ncbi:hypothetical protein AVEN_136415-1 [Araneus ventricosus]|uniref:Uncharacterized protein n=1 Tax=Araneus ventricosus TaxID=182803 RepID=A0A4Y2LR07_ARAVE|nr:hypothetical protein AVEN_136415-1 [Araneus ventricosus]
MKDSMRPNSISLPYIKRVIGLEILETKFKNAKKSATAAYTCASEIQIYCTVSPDERGHPFCVAALGAVRPRFLDTAKNISFRTTLTHRNMFAFQNYEATERCVEEEHDTSRASAKRDKVRVSGSMERRNTRN